MERFKSATAARYAPSAVVHATRECDAVVRTSSAHAALHLALGSCGRVRFVAPEASRPLVWVDATARVEDALRGEGLGSSCAIAAAYGEVLESVTIVNDHEYLARPAVVVLGAWVGESGIVERLKAVDPGDNIDGPRAVVLVARSGSRQDDAACGSALDTARERYGEGAVRVVRMGATEGREAPDNVAAELAQVVTDAIQSAIVIVGEDADKARRATRSTFRSWFGGGGTAGTALRAPAAVSSVAARGSDSSQSDTAGSMTSASVAKDGVGGEKQVAHIASSVSSAASLSPRQRRRVSVGGGSSLTPLFPPESVEALSRHVADLHMLAGHYQNAVDAYRLLSHDLRALSGSALVHEASAVEMTALALALTDSSKREVGNGLERAIDLYSKAGRRELAVRAAMRAVDFCFEAGFPDSAAGVALRAIGVIVPAIASSSSLGSASSVVPSSSFVECAAAVLSSRCAVAFSALSRRRRAALYAFLASTRFSKLGLHAVAAAMIRDIDESALARPGVQDDVDLTLGHAELTVGRYARAVGHFVRVMSGATDDMDVEVQSRAIQGFFIAVAQGPGTWMSRRWDSSAMFPLLLVEESHVSTFESYRGGDRAWRVLEDDVLEDQEYFKALRAVSPSAPKNALPKRERRLESVIAELRRQKELGGRNDPGGSLEMKIRRMREAAENKRKRRRARSLLERGAVVGEVVTLHITLRNPLQFPVFVNDVTAVVTLDGTCHTKEPVCNEDMEGMEESADAGAESCSHNQSPVRFIPVEDLMLVPCSAQTVPLKVVVHTPGTLKFIGARWCFTIGMGSASPRNAPSVASGYSVLERRGRRLNDTRHQRASEVPLYEEDTSLVIAITPPAPRLVASLVHSAPPIETGSLTEDEKTVNCLELRQGEKRCVTLFLTNQGSVAAEDVVFRIGTPQTLFMHTTSTDIAEQRQEVDVIDINEETTSRKGLVVAGSLPLRLQAGESVERTLWLRTSVADATFGSGLAFGGIGSRSATSGKSSGSTDRYRDSVNCEARLIFAYGSGVTRVSRFNTRMLVRPSVIVSPRFLRAADLVRESNASPTPVSDVALDAVLLGIEVEHAGSTSGESMSFEVSHVSVTSRTGWKPFAVPEPSMLSAAVDIQQQNASTFLRINETATVFITLQRPNQQFQHEENAANLKAIDSEKAWVTSSIPLTQKKPPRQRSPVHVTEPSAIDGESKENESLEFERESADDNESETAHLASEHFTVHSKVTMHQASVPNMVLAAIGWRTPNGVVGEIYVPPLDPLQWMNWSSSDGTQPLALGHD